MRKETGLMFKAPLVLAILAGQKTQTRRIVKWKGLQKGLNLGFSGLRAGNTGDNWVLESNTPTSSEWRCTPTPCPFGKPGDRIYVREAHAHHPHFPQMAFRADGEEFEDADGFLWEPKWTPAIHMKKEEARIWLEITGVRVERLQQITDADALAEGVDRTNTSIPGYARERFQRLWDSTTGRPTLPANTNSKRYARVKQWLDTHPDTTGWAANLWVWVIDFKTISTTGRPA